MVDKQVAESAKQILRAQALEKLLQIDELEKEIASAKNADSQKLMHELMVHQIELETQNEELLATKEQKKLALQRFTNLFEFAPITYCTLTQNTEIKSINLNGANKLGIARSALVGKRLAAFVVREFLPLFNKQIDKVFIKKESASCEIKIKVNSHTLWVHANFSLDKSCNQCLAALTDITEQKQAADLIEKQANFDHLTGLPNRRLFLDRLIQELKFAKRHGANLALLSIDLDHFKDINDSLGHQTGDELLVETANRLKACIRSIDTVSRLGGDDFSIIMGELESIESTEILAKRILNCLSAPFHLGNNIGYVSASVGVAVYPEDGESSGSLIKNADQAMYAAKSDGRNCMRYFTKSMQEKVQKRLNISNELRTAIENNEFWMAYQPIVNLRSGQLYKAESLLRWQHPQLGNVPPMEFIPIAEESGLIGTIGSWVFKQATFQAAQWSKSLRPDFQISINMSPAQFRNERSNHKEWLQHLNKMNLNTKNLVIEITENLLMDMNSQVMAQLDSFDAAGIEISLDDFGTGYSSLSYLKKFHIDYLKIDQSFVDDLTSNSDNMALCEAIVVMAHKLGLKVIAEGIETEQQRNLLLKIGCDYGQGYLFSKPLSAEQFEIFAKTEQTQ